MSHISQPVRDDQSLQSLWETFNPSQSSQAHNTPDAQEEKSATQNGFYQWMGQYFESSVQAVHSFVVNRGGLAYLTGLMIVPSQFGLNVLESKNTIQEAIQQGKRNQIQIKPFNLELENGDTIGGVIYYPPNWKPADHSRCLLYHNPNGITVAGYFENGKLSWAPKKFVQLEKCPLILYDYRGTGLSKDNLCASSIPFKPTYESVVVDGMNVLQYALKTFKHVDTYGSSLGGGVATVSLQRHLAKHDDFLRVTLLNHDSFTNTARVVLPNTHWLADSLGYVVGGTIHAEKSMKDLINRRIPITILAHLKDPVIPQGARMVESIEPLNARNVTIIKSNEYGHANLSDDMFAQLQRKQM